MKKLLSYLLAFTIIFTSFGSLKVFAAENSENQNYDTIETNENYLDVSEIKPNDLPEEQYISPLRDRDGSDAYELALMIQYDLFSANTAAWHPGGFDSTVESIVYHYKEHGKEVGAKNATSYINKAVEFRRTAKKGSTKSKVKGETYGVIRYKKNGKYIDLAPDNRIISFGKQ